MKEEALKLADELTGFMGEDAYTALDKTIFKTVAMIRRLVEELDNSKALADKYCKRNVELQEKITKLLDKQGKPVAWRASNWSHSVDDYVYRDYDDPPLDANGNIVGEPLYTTPQQWYMVNKDGYVKPLSDEEIHDIWKSLWEGGNIGHIAYNYARAIEERHGIK